jgi:hypothetical protein
MALNGPFFILVYKIIFPIYNLYIIWRYYMADTLYVTISKVDDKHLKVVWDKQENIISIISKKDLYDFMEKIADNANNNLKVGCLFEID